MGRVESMFQAKLVRKLRELFPGCLVLKNDANYLQGIPDLLILFRDTWAALECKANHGAREQPNQDHYVELMNGMSFAAFIHPGNEEEVLGDLQRSFEARGSTRVLERQQVSLDKLRRSQTGGGVAKRASSTERNRTSRARPRTGSSRDKASEVQ